jgi:hypothetical protein
LQAAQGGPQATLGVSSRGLGRGCRESELDMIKVRIWQNKAPNASGGSPRAPVSTPYSQTRLGGLCEYAVLTDQGLCEYGVLTEPLGGLRSWKTMQNTKSDLQIAWFAACACPWFRWSEARPGAVHGGPSRPDGRSWRPVDPLVSRPGALPRAPAPQPGMLRELSPAGTVRARAGTPAGAPRPIRREGKGREAKEREGKGKEGKGNTRLSSRQDLQCSTCGPRTFSCSCSCSCSNLLFL